VLALAVIPSEARNPSVLLRRTCAFLTAVVLAFSVAAIAQKKPPSKPIDINTASIEQLQQLPGIGPVTAKSIFDFRKKSGPFRRVEDLLAIRGISEKRFIAIRPYVIVPAAAAKPVAAPPKAATASPKPATPPNAAAAPRPATTPKPTAPPR
jgi:competence ComEA-like helix-hairpin-helix protein